MRQVEKILRDAGIDAYLTSNIKEVLWEKFFFVSPYATLTSYLDKTAGQIREDASHMELLTTLMMELKQIIEKFEIKLPVNILEKTLDKLSKLPYDATTSMHRDFQRGKKTELDSLTGYVVKMGKQLNIPTPLFEHMLKDLSAKQSQP